MGIDQALMRMTNDVLQSVANPINAHPSANPSFLSQQIDDTVNVMKKNLESVAQRGEHIDQLQDKSENLNQSAQGFRRGANRVRKQMWWKNVKMRIWIGVGIIVLLLIIIIPAGTSSFHPSLWFFKSLHFLYLLESLLMSGPRG